MGVSISSNATIGRHGRPPRRTCRTTLAPSATTRVSGPHPCVAGLAGHIQVVNSAVTFNATRPCTGDTGDTGAARKYGGASKRTYRSSHPTQTLRPRATAPPAGPRWADQAPEARPRTRRRASSAGPVGAARPRGACRPSSGKHTHAIDKAWPAAGEIF